MTLNTPAARVSEFVRQARRLQDINPDKFHTVYPDPEAEAIDLSLDDLDDLVANAQPDSNSDDVEDLQHRIVASIWGRDGEAGAGSDAYIGEQTGTSGEWLEISGNLDVQHLASDLLADGYGQGVPLLHDAWEAGADAMMDYTHNQHLGIDPPANPYDRYENNK